MTIFYSSLPLSQLKIIAISQSVLSQQFLSDCRVISHMAFTSWLKSYYVLDETLGMGSLSPGIIDLFDLNQTCCFLTQNSDGRITHTFLRNRQRSTLWFEEMDKLSGDGESVRGTNVEEEREKTEHLFVW